MAIELKDGRADTASVARNTSEVLRWLIFEADAIEHFRAQIPTRRDWLGMLDGEPVGVGAVGVPVGLEASGVAVSMLLALREARHRGVGGLLFRQVSEHARTLGSSELLMFSFEDDPDTLGFAARHGFTVVARTRGLRLPLADCPRPEVTPPAGVTITTLAERPELARAVWEVACEAFPDIPHGGDAPMQAGSYEQFVTRALSGPRYIPDATFAAVAGDDVVGYAQLEWMSRAAGIADHAMIAVRQSWRAAVVLRNSRPPRSPGQSTPASTSFGPATKNATPQHAQSTRTSPSFRYPTGSTFAARPSKRSARGTFPHTGPGERHASAALPGVPMVG